jgi:hypothetical protein
MKTICFAALALAVTLAPGRGAPNDFDVKIESKRLGKDRQSNGTEKVSTEQWVYNVTIENRAAKDFADLEVKYIVFTSDAKPGSNEPPKLLRKTGSKPVALIKSRAKTNFTTEPIELVKTQLAGGVTYGSGARPRSNDALEGMWLRIYKGEELVAEIVRPTNLATKESWEKKK